MKPFGVQRSAFGEELQQQKAKADIFGKPFARYKETMEYNNFFAERRALNAER